jgi:hypothetical protein
MATAVGAENGSELVLDIVTSGRFQVDTVELEPGSPENSADPHAVSVELTTGVVAALEFDLVLDVEVDDTNDTVSSQEVRDRVNDRVELGNHAQTVGHGKDVGANAVTRVYLIDRLANAEVSLLVRKTSLVVCQTEGPSILADDVYVLPAQTLKSLGSNLAEGSAQVNQVDSVEEVGHINLLTHLLNVPASSASNIDPNGLLLELTSALSVFGLSGYQGEHILTALEELGAGCIVDGGLRFVEAFERILLVSRTVTSVGFEETRVGELQLLVEVVVGLC